MRWLQKFGAGVATAGLLLVFVGGMHVRGGPDGTWVKVNLVHAAGAAALALGTLLSAVAASGGRSGKAEAPPP